jgi:hypothetical protein
MTTEHDLRDALRASVVLEPEQIARAEAAATQTGLSLEHAVLELGLLGEDQVRWLAADAAGLALVFPTEDGIDEELLACFPAAELRGAGALPLLREEDGTVVVAFAATPPAAVVERLSRVCGAPVRPALASGSRLHRVLGSILGSERESPAPPPTSDASGVNAFYRHLTASLGGGASELRFEPGPEDVRVRYRIDGALVETGREPLSTASVVSARIRRLAEFATPTAPTAQSRSVNMTISGQRRRVNVAIVPTKSGDVVVIRAQAEVRVPERLDGWSLELPDRDWLEQQFARPGDARGTLRVRCGNGAVRSAFVAALASAADEHGLAVAWAGGQQPPGTWTIASDAASVVALSPDLVVIGSDEMWTALDEADALSHAPRVVLANSASEQVATGATTPPIVADAEIDVDVGEGQAPHVRIVRREEVS